MISRALIVIVLSLVLAACGGQSTWRDGAQSHIVRKGETLFAIAWRYGKDPDDVARWNRLGDGSLIYPGQVLRLTPPSGAADRICAHSASNRHRPCPHASSRTAHPGR